MSSSQYHSQDEEGNYAFGYNNVNGARQEVFDFTCAQDQSSRSLRRGTLWRGWWAPTQGRQETPSATLPTSGVSGSSRSLGLHLLPCLLFVTCSSAHSNWNRSFNENNPCESVRANYEGHYSSTWSLGGFSGPQLLLGPLWLDFWLRAMSGAIA